MKQVTVAEMRRLEEQAMNGGVSPETLMERAGHAAAEIALAWVRQRFPGASAPTHWIVLAGKGQNGGDAWVAARRLRELDPRPVYLFSTMRVAELTGAARAHAERLPTTIHTAVIDHLPNAALASGGIILDGLLGTGVQGEPRPPLDRLIRQVNDSGLPVVSLDLPSGLDADSGTGTSVIADLTITIGLPKRGLLTPAGRPRCGQLRVANIGLSSFTSENAATPEVLFAGDIRPLLRRRPHDAHKNQFGHLLVLGGSAAYTGAPLLAASAALRSGAGLVTLAVPCPVRPCLPPALAAVMIIAYNRCEEWAPLLDKIQAVVVGPGAGQSDATARLLATLLATRLPVVVDADALRELARTPQIASRSHATVTVLTPHPGEAHDLLNGFGLHDLLTSPRERQALGLAMASGCHVIFKGQATVLAAPDGHCAINSSGTSGLATAGSGDVLAGLTGGLLAQGFSPWDAIRAAVFIHGRAAELAPHGSRALVADDLVNLIGPAFQSVTPFA